MLGAEAVANIFESALFVIFMVCFLGYRERNVKSYIITVTAGVLLLLNIMLSDSIAVINWYPAIIDLIIVICFARLTLKGGMINSIFGFGLYYLGMYASTITGAWILSMAEHTWTEAWFTTTDEKRVLFLLLCKSILFLYAVFVIVKKKHVKVKENKNIYITFVLLPVLVCWIFTFLIELLNKLYYYENSGKLIMSALIAVIIMSAAVMILTVYVLKSENKIFARMLATEKESVSQLITSDGKLDILTAGNEFVVKILLPIFGNKA